MASVVQYGDKYRIQVCLGRRPDGSQINKRTTYKCNPNLSDSKNRKLAEEYAREFEKECKNSGLEENKIKFEDVAEQFFKDNEGVLKIQTLNCYRQYTDFIYHEIGYIYMRDLKPKHIRTVVKKLQEKGDKPLSNKTIRNYIAFISSVCKYAMTLDIIDRNPCSNVVLPKKETKEVEVYSLEEIQTIINCLKDEPNNRYITVILAIFCGLRRGEIFGLEWSDIDFDNKIISINRTSMYNSVNKMYVGTPKTVSSVRSIPISDNLLRALIDYKFWQNCELAKVNSDTRVYSNRLLTRWNGEPENPQMIEKWWFRFCNRHKIRYVKFHSLRHFHATQLIATGADIKTVSSLLGHKQITTTLDIYSHSVNMQKAKATQAIDGNIGIDLSRNMA